MRNGRVRRSSCKVATSTKTKQRKSKQAQTRGKKTRGRRRGGGTPIFLPYSLSINTCSLHGLLLFPALAKAQRCLIDAHLSADQ